MPVPEQRPRYEEIERELGSLLDGCDDATAALSTAAALLFAHLPAASWVGFYRVVAPGLLRVGPYQGGIGCLEIPFDRGVCGAAASRGETVVVPDVSAFAGHIACDPDTRSEIVVPVRDAGGRLVAVLDLDSRDLDAFGDADRIGLEGIAAALTPHLG